MERQKNYPHRAFGFALSGDEAPVLLNGMRVLFSERVPLYPVDLEKKPVLYPQNELGKNNGSSPKEENK
jgi:hypothetical protein